MHAANPAPIIPIRSIPATVRTRGSAAPSAAVNCSSCHLKDLCVPAGLPEGDVHRLDALRFGRRRVKAGETLIRQGDRFHFIYAVRSGTFKTAIALSDGGEQVTGFRMAGEFMGLDGVARGVHDNGAVALEDGEVCSIPFAQLGELAPYSRGLQMVAGRLMSQEIVRDHSLLVLLASTSAEERVAAFVMNISQRMLARGYSGREFHLRMDRRDIGSYLGLKIETVSRTLSAFQQRGLIEVDKKHIRILDLDGLAAHFDERLQ